MSTCSIEPSIRPDLALMERWAAWVFELLHGTADRATDQRTQAILSGAAEDAEALRRVIEAAIAGGLDDELTAALRSIYELWDANQDRYERLASEVDPESHRQWVVRSATTRPTRQAQRAGTDRRAAASSRTR